MIYALLIFIFLLASLLVFPVGVELDYSERGRRWYVIWMWLHIPVPAFVRRIARREERRLLEQTDETEAGGFRSAYMMIRNFANSMRGGREKFEIGLETLRSVTRHLKIRVHRLNVLVATPDPALTGFSYGMMWAGIGAFSPSWPISVDVDFVDTTPKVDFRVEARIMLITLLPAARTLVRGVRPRKR